MIDLSKLKAGDTVKFRCGGKAVVKSIDYRYRQYSIVFEDEEDSWDYHFGGFFIPSEPCLIDIIEIIPKPFDWSDAKPGMAFEQGRDKILVYFLGYHPVKPFRLFFIGEEAITAESFSVKAASDQLTRAPEHDIEVS